MELKICFTAGVSPWILVFAHQTRSSTSLGSEVGMMYEVRWRKSAWDQPLINAWKLLPIHMEHSGLNQA